MDEPSTRRQWRWVPFWVSKSRVVLELLGQVRVLDAKNALLERERAVSLHQLDWFAELITELRQREAALFQAQYGVTMPAPGLTVTAPNDAPAPAPAATMPTQVSVRDVMGQARDVIDRVSKGLDPFADPMQGADPGSIFDDMGDDLAQGLGISHDNEGRVRRPSNER